jgi:hypothetical protein
MRLKFKISAISNKKQIPELPYLPIQRNDLGTKTNIFTGNLVNSE